jgi:hypothetical protein
MSIQPVITIPYEDYFLVQPETKEIHLLQHHQRALQRGVRHWVEKPKAPSPPLLDGLDFLTV